MILHFDVFGSMVVKIDFDWIDFGEKWAKIKLFIFGYVHMKVNWTTLEAKATNSSIESILIIKINLKSSESLLTLSKLNPNMHSESLLA
jgi:hypothetical protein